jgi:hypothetical protein
MAESRMMISMHSEYSGGSAVRQSLYTTDLTLKHFTDDTLLPGLHFKVPLFIVLDTLQSPDPQLKRTAETWLRCSLRSYIRFDRLFPFARLSLNSHLRVLDPLLFDLMDPMIIRLPGVVSWQGREMRTFSYERPFDVNRMKYLVETMLALVHFGGQGLGRVARMTPLKKTQHPDLFARAQAGKSIFCLGWSPTNHLHIQSRGW